MFTKEEIDGLKEITKLKENEISSAINAPMPEVLKKVAGGLTLKEIRVFREKKIYNLSETENEKGDRVPLDHDAIFIDIVAPLLEMRGVSTDDIDNSMGGDLINYYNRVAALTNNPKLKKEIEKKK